MNLQARPPTPNPEGIFDLNIILNFGKQWPEMKDFAYETRDMLFSTLYDWLHIGAMGVGFLLGIMLTVVVVLILRRRGLAAILVACLSTLGIQAQDGREPMVDLVTIPYVDKNFGSNIDGSGMCVFNSFRACLVSQYRDDFDDYARWLARHYQGGGYPSRVTEYTRAYCRSKGIEGFDDQYVQIVGSDTLEAIREALEDGRSVAVTDSGDVSFYGRPVPHMTNIVYLDDQWAAIVDNNRPDRTEWISREAFIKRHRHYDSGWCIVYLGKPQLARPVNEIPDSRRRRDRDSFYFRPVGLFQDCRNGTCFTVASNVSEGWSDQGNGVWYYHRNGARVGEYHEKNKTYYIYRGDGAGRSWLEPAERPDGVKSQAAGDKLTGVVYEGFPKLHQGQTLYGYGSMPISDPVSRRLYEDRVKKDRHKARVVVNGSSDLEKRVRDLLRRLGSDAFVYGREAWDVIRAMGYGQGVTVTTGSKRGVALDISFFSQEPSESQLREALIKSDPSYRPGGGAVADMVDSVAVIMIVILVALVGVYWHVYRSKAE